MVNTESQATQQVPRSQVGRRILRATGALMLIQVVLKGFGLIEKMILGHLFGTSYLTDAYNAAKDIAFYIFQLVDQVVMHSFLPVFVARMREEGEKDAWRLASSAINILMLIMLPIVVLGIIFAPNVLPFFVPNWFAHPADYPADLVPLSIKLMRALLIAVIFLATSSLTYCLLNSYKQFALPASADLVLKGTVLVFAVILAKTWGPYALAVGFIAGALAKVFVHGFGLRRQIVHYRPVIDTRNTGLSRFALLALPLILSTFVSIIRQAFDTRFASGLPEGSLSALKFAKTLCDVPVQFFPFMFGIALFPFIADIAVAGDRQRLREMLMLTTRLMILIFLPLAATIIALQTPIVYAVFGPKSLSATEPLRIYAIYMLAGALEIIVLQFFFAMSDTLWPSIMAIVLVPFHIGFAYLGIHKLGWGVLAIAGALLFSKSTKVVILYGMIRRKLDSLEGRQTLVMIGKVAIALVPLLAILLAGNYFLPPPIVAADAGKAAKILAVLPYMFSGMFAALAYLGTCYLLRVRELDIIIDKLQHKLKRTPEAQAPESSIE